MEEVFAEILSNPLVTGAASAVGIAVVALWLAAAWWAHTDAQRRTGSELAGLAAAAWVVVSTPLLLPLSLAVYTFARPQQTAAEHRSRKLVAELVDQLENEAVEVSSCAACGAASDPAWLRCPTCATWLALPCAHCGGWSEARLEICPWCGNDERAEPTVEELEPVGGQLGRRRRARRALRAMGPGRGVVGRGLGSRNSFIPDGRPLTPARGR